jgi:hypothetical protein
MILFINEIKHGMRGNAPPALSKYWLDPAQLQRANPPPITRIHPETPKYPKKRLDFGT